MTKFVSDLLRISAGSFVEFSWVIWLLVTAALILVSFILVGAIPRTTSEVAVEHARKPGKSFVWGLACLVLSGLLMSLLVVTVVGIPVAMLVAIYLVCAAIFGYIAVGMVWADRVARLAGSESLNPYLAAVSGVALFRVIRLIPFGIGSIFQALVFVVSVGATTILAWQMAISWYNRRLPDHVQFKDDGVIEWPEDPDASVD